MYRISAPDEKIKYDLSELAKMFITAEDFQIDVRENPEDKDEGTDLYIPADGTKNDHKRQLYDFLSGKTGKVLDWGILTGVRPGKLYNEMLRAGKDPEEILSREYYVSEPKIGLLRAVSQTQRTVIQDEAKGAAGIYIGIPFCPTRCQYCSFTSNKITKPAAVSYLQALFKEMEATADIMKRRGYYAESIYIGGGTPTSLDDEDFEALLAHTRDIFLTDKCIEFTVEGGRPETITANKLRLIKEYGADRISINPQTMKQHTLDLIGRLHSPEDIEKAFKIADGSGIDVINADLITGLPEETPEDFEDSLKKVIALGPENITVHTLAVKKASRLIEEDSTLGLRQASNVRKMLDIGEKLLAESDYHPYYMYRQKHMSGNFENVGYAKPGTASVYNIRIMEENQTIIAMGAGAISKVYFPEENRLERVANVSNYQIYIERIDEMIERKERGIL